MNRWADHYTRKAREAGYPARSVFKLEEMDTRFGVLKRGSRVLDLGAAPGSWTRYALARGAVRLVAGDLLDRTLELWSRARELPAGARRAD